MNCRIPGLPVHHQFPEFTQTQVHQVGDAIQPSHRLLSHSPPAPNPSPFLSWKKHKLESRLPGEISITSDMRYSHEIKRRLLLGMKVMTNLESIVKSRDITLPTKVCLVKAMVFPVVMNGCESWTVKKAEC